MKVIIGIIFFFSLSSTAFARTFAQIKASKELRVCLSNYDGIFTI